MTVLSAPMGPKIVFLATFVGSLHLLTLAIGVCVWRLYAHGMQDMFGQVVLWTLGVGAVVPLSWTQGETMKRFIQWICGIAGEYFPVKVICEDASAFKTDKSYVLALEPHSALPLAIPIVFAPDSPLLPEFFRGRLFGMASSVCFVMPLIRQLWWALGLRPVSKDMLSTLLKEGSSVILCPGGVQECLYMDHNSETLFLTKRTGFVRLALQHGSPLVPVFVFGQSQGYNWWRPGPDGFIRWLSRQMGVVPLLIWGRWGTPIPNKAACTVIVGKPMEVPHITSPSHDEIAKYLRLFIEEMEAMITRHKSAAGVPDIKVHIM